MVSLASRGLRPQTLAHQFGREAGPRCAVCVCVFLSHSLNEGPHWPDSQPRGDGGRGRGRGREREREGERAHASQWLMKGVGEGEEEGEEERGREREGERAHASQWLMKGTVEEGNSPGTISPLSI